MYRSQLFHIFYLYAFRFMSLFHGERCFQVDNLFGIPFTTIPLRRSMGTIFSTHSDAKSLDARAFDRVSFAAEKGFEKCFGVNKGQQQMRRIVQSPLSGVKIYRFICTIWRKIGLSPMGRFLCRRKAFFVIGYLIRIRRRVRGCNGKSGVIATLRIISNKWTFD